MKTKVITVIAVVIALIFTLASVAQQQRNNQAQQSTSAGAAEPILAKLSEIVAIRERLFNDYESLSRAGRAPADHSAEIDLAEARVDLARERGQPDAVLMTLKNLVAAHERRLKRVQDLTRDRGSLTDVARAKVELLAAEVRLLRAQK